jgi:uncharacterized protein YyaL (SSP411 family)
MPNRLADETSPYLLQHQNNPVDWYPWGDEAFERARAEDRPIFLSVGYSACHWCHVMERESFEDEETAAFLNEHFVSIKVDREERPDVDAIYMSAVQAISGGGGWPMSVWLLPDGRPFYGGTYFPKTPRYGMPSFRQVLERIVSAFRENRAALERDAGSLTGVIERHVELRDGHDQLPPPEVLDAAFQALADRYDSRHGGFGQQPKFPPSMSLDLLLRLYHRHGWEHALEMVTHTLDRMAWGGMYDQIGGGFHRYSVDAAWLVPHFEKMLYDNALLIGAYLHGYQVTGEPRYREVVEGTIAYIEREMTDPAGGFYSTQDADSEGEEGKFFVWQEEELRDALGEAVNVEAVLDYWGVAQGPNFEGHNILWVPEAPEKVAVRHDMAPDALLAEVEKARTILFERREGRIKPGRDEKILTAWNGLMISRLAQAARVLERDDYAALAANAASFVLAELRRDGRLLRSYKDGQAKFNAYLEDYAFLIEGLIELYQATFDLRWFKEALALTGLMVELFWDDEAGFYDTSHDHEALIFRPQDLGDGATPAGTSGAVASLLRMAILADRPDWREKAERILARLGTSIQTYPGTFAYLAGQLDFALSGAYEIALVGDPSADETRALLRVINRSYRPNQVLALRHANGADAAADLIPLLAEREMVNGAATAYVCRNFVCRLPVTTPDALEKELTQPDA